MSIEIVGAGFENKGAELMLRTTVSELRKRMIDPKLAIDPFYGSFEDRSELKLRQMFPKRNHVGSSGFEKKIKQQQFYSKPIFEKVLRKFPGLSLFDYGIETINTTSALIDIAGFAYTEEWGVKPTEDFATLAEVYKKNKKPVIMLPQALGPFKSPNIIKAFNKVIQNATLIYARDQESFQNARNISDSPNILLAPDITLFSNDSADFMPDSSGHICIVPNIRMLDQGKSKWQENYENLLLKFVEHLMPNEILYFVIHDSSGGDLQFTRDFLQKNNLNHIKVLQVENPFALKKFISRSKFIIGSRYHALVSSFSKSVPSIALGWSHKYEMLYHDFELSDFIITSETSISEAIYKVNILLEEKENSIIRNRIKNKLEVFRVVNEDMWEKVTKTLIL